MFKPFLFLFLAACICLDPTFGKAQETKNSTSFDLELNLSKNISDRACQLVFRGANRLGENLDDVSFRLAVFDKNRSFMTMLGLPLGRMIDGKTRAVQFNLKSSCDAISEIIVNEASSCKFAGSDDNRFECIDRLNATTLSKIGFGI